MDYVYYKTKYKLNSLDTVEDTKLRILLQRTSKGEREHLCVACEGNPKKLIDVLQRKSYKILPSIRSAAKYYVRHISPEIKEDIYASINFQSLAIRLKHKGLLVQVNNSYVLFYPEVTVNHEWDNSSS